MSEPVTRRKHKRPRPQISCAVCHRRKVKCDKSLPCAQCIKYGCQDECRFDGLPAKQEHESASSETLASAPTESFDAYQERNNTTYLGAPSFTATPYQPDSTQRPTLDQAYTAPPRYPPLQQSHQAGRSQLITHDWIPGQGPLRGRTHVSWSSQPFDRLLAYAGMSLTEETDSEASTESSAVPTSPKTSVAGLPDSIFEDLPPITTACGLIVRYLDTLDTVYPVLDREAFENDTRALLEDPRNASTLHIMKSLLVQAMASATYPMGQAPVMHGAACRWLQMASSCLTTMIESGKLSIDGLRLFALLCLAEQVLKQDVTACYLRSGSCVRAAMALGLQRAEDATSRSLWWCISELDLNACLAAGMPPSAATMTNSEVEARSRTSTYSREDIRHILQASLPTRQKIATTLNTEKHLHFDQILQLSSDVNRTMAPISTISTADDNTFGTQFLSFVYTTHLSALHRPFATIADPAFYLSRSTTLRLSKSHLTSLTSSLRQDRQDTTSSSPFTSLLSTPGPLFRPTARHAIMSLSHELYRSDNSAWGLEAMLTLPADSRASILATLRELFSAAEVRVKEGTFWERGVMVPGMVFAHLDATEKFAVESAEYVRYMANVGEAARKCKPARA